MILTTLSHRLFVARPEAAANTTFSTNLATQGNFANKPTGAIDLLDPAYLDPTVETVKSISVPAVQKVNGLVFYFAGGDAANDIFTWTIFAWRNENGPAEIATDGTGILGTQQVVIYPHNNVATTADKFWADTLVVSNDRWLKEVEATTEGGNSVSKVWLDAAGYRFWYIEIPTSVGVMATYFGYW